VTGLFELLNTHGIPIPISLEIMRTKGMIPDWIDFVERSRGSGWKDKTILSRLSEGVLEVYGQEWHDGWSGRMEKILGE